MVNWIKKYCLWIILTLFVLFMLQTCRSCNKSNTLAWTETETITMVDSLNKAIDERDKQIDNLTSSLREAESKIEIQKNLIESLTRDKEFLKESNTKLNSNLKKSLDKNEKPE